MPAIQTRKNKVGNFLKKELWSDQYYCRVDATLTYADLGKQEAGEIVYKANDAATKYVAAPAAIDPATANIAIVVDDEIDDKIAEDLALDTPTGDIKVAVLTRGPAVVRKGGLSIADDTDIADAYAVLEANGVMLVDYFSTSSQA